jgi:hypothetical protein
MRTIFATLFAFAFSAGFAHAATYVSLPPVTSKMITVDRTNPSALCDNWRTMERAERVLKIRQFDISDVKLVTTLAPGQKRTSVAHHINRLKPSDGIRLDCRALMAILQTMKSPPEEWRYDRERVIYFDGAIYQDDARYDRVLRIHYGSGAWRVSFDLVSPRVAWHASYVSAVLPVR